MCIGIFNAVPDMNVTAALISLVSIIIMVFNNEILKVRMSHIVVERVLN